MLARAALVAAALVSPAWAGPDDYPVGLFENSPVNDAPAAVHESHVRQAKNLPSEHSGGCHHYRVWSYPWPQPC
jgi:hypothetical protein